jgi:2-amino-4-hydroxy-6-hydroxymethyldihydropteridine diphosphokinase
MPRCLLGLGSNVGDRPRQIAAAVDALRNHPRTSGLTVSSLHETPPAGGPQGQVSYLNAAVVLNTDLSPGELLTLAQSIERQLGRERLERWGPRTIDVDLLLYGEAVINEPLLIVPHPRMAFRRFVLEPAVEVAAEMRHPPTGWTLEQLLEHLRRSPCYVALLGVAGEAKTDLAKELANRCGGQFLADPGAISAQSGGSHSSGHEWLAPIEFLDARAGVLAADRWPAPERLVVSDFYLDQCLAYAGLQHAGTAYDDVTARWQAIRGSVVAPRLVVLLLPDNTVLEQDGRQQELIAQFVRLASRPQVAPVLTVDPADCRRAMVEMVAAATAMR